MRRWIFEIDVKNLWQQASDRVIEVDEFKKKLYDILSNYTQKINALSLDAIKCFNDLMSKLNDIEFEDYDDFDIWMKEFYDFCDDYRIWIKTF